MNNTLLPCPFCGGEADIEEIPGIPFTNEPYVWAVGCEECNIGWYKETKEAAIAAWNRRADHIRDTTKKVSNADRIRGMTDEELAEYIFDLGNGSEYCYGHCLYQSDDDLCEKHSARGLKHKGCIQGVMGWLTHPAKMEDKP